MIPHAHDGAQRAHMPRHRRPALVACAVVLLCLSAAGATSAGRYYKWVDEDGQVHYGDRLPAERVRQERQVVNDEGVVVETLERAKTPEEIAAEQRRAAAAAEAERRAAERAARDRVLLDSYATLEDMELAREGKINAIEAVIAVTNSRIERLEQQQAQYETEAAAHRAKDQPPPPALEEKLAEVRTQLDKNRAYVERKRAEQERIRTQYAEDMARFRELKGVE